MMIPTPLLAYDNHHSLLPLLLLLLFPSLLLLLPQITTQQPLPFFLHVVHAAGEQCGVQARGSSCPDPDDCCSEYGYCDVGEAWCGDGCQGGMCHQSDAAQTAGSAIIQAPSTTNAPTAARPPPTPTPSPSSSFDDYVDAIEYISMRFSVVGGGGLPEGEDDILVAWWGDDRHHGGGEVVVRREMTTIMTRVLFALEERILGLKILSVGEGDDAANNNNAARRATNDGRMGGGVISAYYDVVVVRGDDDEEFGPVIIRELRESYDEILDEM